jgi:hypothetical protein
MRTRSKSKRKSPKAPSERRKKAKPASRPHKSTEVACEDLILEAGSVVAVPFEVSPTGYAMLLVDEKKKCSLRPV